MRGKIVSEGSNRRGAGYRHCEEQQRKEQEEGRGYVEGRWKVGGGYMEDRFLKKRSMPLTWIFSIGNECL
jgi:hypothetical protein